MGDVILIISLQTPEMATAQAVILVLWVASLCSCSPQGRSLYRYFGDNEVVDGPTAKPVYNVQYRVADNEEQTYIKRDEARDGDSLEGSYSYVDAEGSLVTVHYEAGLQGYTEEREKQEGFVQIRAGPIETKFDTRNIDETMIESEPLTKSAVGTKDDIVSKILAVLQPIISKTVEEAL